MKQIDFDNGKITSNILNAVVPMLVAQILSLLYNIVDRIYIACIPHVGTASTRRGGTVLSADHYDYGIQQSVRKRWQT